MSSWHQQRMAALDFESSDKIAETARIVTAALILVGGGLPTDVRTWLIAPGIPMEPEAIAVHGITDEYAAAHGQPAEQGVADIAKAIAEIVTAGVPIVGHNIGQYDLTLADRECRRHLGASLEEVCCQPLTRVIDTRVLDQQVLPFRRRVSPTQGARQLITLAQVYGFPWDETAAHGAEYDALMSARIAFRIGQIGETPAERRPDSVLRERVERFGSLTGLDVDALHQAQIGWAAEQAAGLQEFFRRSDPNAFVNPHWPLIPATAEEVTS